MRKLFTLTGLVAAILLPLAKPATQAAPLDSTSLSNAFPGWPKTFEGRTLERLPLTEREQILATGFPGRIGRFHDGQREIVLRWVTRPTRKLHPVSHCFVAHGWELRQRTITTDADGNAWAALTFAKDGEVQRVREAIHDGDGQRWTDVSAWYWSALLERSPAPWWAVAVTGRPLQAIG